MCRSKTGKPRGLAAEVYKILDTLAGIDSVVEGKPRGYMGKPKVRIPQRWPHRNPEITVCDVDEGECTLRLRAQKPGAILRLLSAQLQQKGISVV